MAIDPSPWQGKFSLSRAILAIARSGVMEKIGFHLLVKLIEPTNVFIAQIGGRLFGSDVTDRHGPGEGGKGRADLGS